MKKTETSLKDCYILEPIVHGDHRGWFYESFNDSVMKDLGLTCDFIQDNHSMSTKKGVLRGLHFQLPPKAQTKLVRCTKGSILDVVVDLRKGSPSFLKSFQIELSEENKKQLYIPKGFAHGFITLTDNVEIQYKVDEFYSKKEDRSIRYDDPDLGIQWDIGDLILSEKDLNAPFLKDSDVNFVYGENI